MSSPLLKENQNITGSGRNHGIDLLRLVLMFMVCMLHTLGQGGILNASAEGTNDIEHIGFWKFCLIAPLMGLQLLVDMLQATDHENMTRLLICGSRPFSIHLS